MGAASTVPAGTEHHRAVVEEGGVERDERAVRRPRPGGPGRAARAAARGPARRAGCGSPRRRSMGADESSGDVAAVHEHELMAVEGVAEGQRRQLGSSDGTGVAAARAAGTSCARWRPRWCAASPPAAWWGSRAPRTRPSRSRAGCGATPAPRGAGRRGRTRTPRATARPRPGRRERAAAVVIAAPPGPPATRSPSSRARGPGPCRRTSRCGRPPARARRRARCSRAGAGSG